MLPPLLLLCEEILNKFRIGSKPPPQPEQDLRRLVFDHHTATNSFYWRLTVRK
jgi:hypothetical protein